MKKRELVIKVLIEQTLNTAEHTPASYRTWLEQFATNDLEEMLQKLVFGFRFHAKPRMIHDIAKEIRIDWKKVNFGAEPYLKALEKMSVIEQDYGYDSGESIVRYFLSNASGWRGETAKRIKLELKGMI